MTPRARRFMWVGIGLAVLALAAYLVVQSLRQNQVFFYTPTDVAQQKAPKDRVFRVGGLVTVGSVARKPDGLTVAFSVTDTQQTIPMTYTGILPDLFKEGKGVVAQGRFGNDGVFRANEVLAKHDENYMPPEAAEALKRAGHPIEGKVFAGQKPVVTQAGSASNGAKASADRGASSGADASPKKY
jgi:cytochrome c-type biogenesis protein CcmE